MEIESFDQYLQVGAKLHEAPDDIRKEGMRAMFRFEQQNPGARERAKFALSDLELNPLYAEQRARQKKQAEEEEEGDAAKARTEALKYVPAGQRMLAEKAYDAPSLPTEGLVTSPDTEEAIAARRLLAGETEDKSQRLRSLSGRPDLYAPPENVGRLPDTIRGWISRAFTTRVWHEPPVDMARQYWARNGMDPEQAKNITEDSDAYKEFADAAWRTAYEQAEREGRPLKRQSQEDLSTLGGKATRFLEDAGDAYDAFRGGARSAIFPGSDQAIDAAEGALLGAATGEGARETSIQKRAELQEAKARHPVMTTLGGVAGSLLPSPVSKVARAGFNAAAKGGAGLARRLGAGAVGGALGGAAQFSGERLVERGLDKLQGLKSAPLKEDLPGLGKAAAYGAAGGLAGQGLAEGASSYRHFLRNGRGAQSDALNKAERAGYQTSIRTGLRPGPLAQQRIDIAKAEGYTPVDVAAREAQPYVEQGARKLEGEVAARHGEEWGRYLNTKAGQTPVSTQPLLDRMLDELRNRKDVSGEDLPFVSTNWKQHVLPLMEMEVLPEGAALPKASRARAEGKPRVYTVFELEQMGFTPEEIAAKIPPVQGNKKVIRGSERANAARDRLLELERKGETMPAFPDTEEGIQARSEYEAELTAARDELLDAQRSLGSIRPAGSNVNELLKNPNTRIVVRGAKKTAEEIDRIQAGVDKAAQLDRKEAGGTADPAYKTFALGVREVRDKLPRNPRAPASLKWQVDTEEGPVNVSGPSALKARQHRERRDVESTLGHAGLPGSLPKVKARPLVEGKPVGPEELDLSVDQQKQLRSTIANYESNAVGSLERDRALRQLAAIADSDGGLRRARDALNQVSGVRFGEEVRGGQVPKDVPASHAGWVRGASRFVSLRLDPIADALSFAPATGSLRQVLDVMRGGLAKQQVFGTAGGELGRRVSSSAQGLDEEDRKNLKILLEASGQWPPEQKKKAE